MLVANMIVGVSQGYRKELEIVGVGYKAELKGKDLQVSVGIFQADSCQGASRASHLRVENQTKIIIDGIDKEMVGQVGVGDPQDQEARAVQGKRYQIRGEHIRRKAGKVAGK